MYERAHNDRSGSLSSYCVVTIKVVIRLIFILGCIVPVHRFPLFLVTRVHAEESHITLKDLSILTTDDNPRPTKRTRKPCESCRTRKQKCVGFSLCSNCQSAKEHCKQPPFAIEEYKK